MRIIWIECILLENWCIEAWPFILRLKSFIYIKIRHNLSTYNYMLFNLVFLFNSLFLHLLAHVFMLFHQKKKRFLSTIIVSAAFGDFFWRGDVEWQSRNFLPRGRRPSTCSPAEAPSTVAPPFHLPGWMWSGVTFNFSFAVGLEWDVAVDLSELKHA